jgi:hypothetical protein
MNDTRRPPATFATLEAVTRLPLEQVPWPYTQAEWRGIRQIFSREDERASLDEVMTEILVCARQYVVSRHVRPARTRKANVPRELEIVTSALLDLRTALRGMSFEAREAIIGSAVDQMLIKGGSPELDALSSQSKLLEFSYTIDQLAAATRRARRLLPRAARPKTGPGPDFTRMRLILNLVNAFAKVYRRAPAGRRQAFLDLALEPLDGHPAPGGDALEKILSAARRRRSALADRRS